MDNLKSTLRKLNIINPSGVLNSNLKNILNKNVKVLQELIINTTFLNAVYHDVSFRQRVYTILQDITKVPTCTNINCNNHVKFARKYNKYCSNRCLGLDASIQDKKKKTTMEHYGVENPSQSKIIVDKKKKTTMEHYGVENPFQSDEIKHKIKEKCKNEHGVDYYVQSKEFRNTFDETMIRKYGVIHAQQVPEIRERTKETFLFRYDVEYPLRFEPFMNQARQTCLSNHGVPVSFLSEEIRNKSKQTCLERYGVENPFSSQEVREKSKETMLKKYGVEHPLNSAELKEKSKQTCLERYGVENHTQKGISNAIFGKLDNKDWLYEQHIEQQKPLMLIASDIGVSDSTVGKYLHKHGILTQNFFQSLGEREVNNFIMSFGIKTITNTRTTIKPYELDIYIPEHNLAIEYCGLYWHSEQAGKDKQYHKIKHDMCAALGIQLITIFEDEWFQKNKQVKGKLASLLGEDNRSKVFARKTQIVSVSKETKKHFFNNNHIQGNCNSSINIGLQHDGDVIACMSFRKNKNGVYELVRFATSMRVVGGFSKLFKYFKQNYEYRQIVSFADLRWSNGNLYYKTEWIVDKILPPDYSYSPDGKTRYHKFNFRRKNLPKLLKIFDKTLSERENCDKNNILRIWDCGKIRFVYNG